MVTREPLTGTKLALLTISLSMATFMLVLDSTIANVAIPTIAGNLGASNSQGTWVITSFGVANAISIPITGWLAKRIGEVKLFLWSTAIFTLSSWLCGISNSLGMLIFFRIIQGMAAGPVLPLCQSLLLNNYPAEKRNMALALWSIMIVVAPICGPILGGYISDNYHWGWIFFINIPIGIVIIFVAMQLLRGRETPTAINPMDIVGLFLLVIGIGSLQMMLDQGKELDWFNSTEIIVLTIIAVIALVFLIVWELTDDHPIIDLTLFKERNFCIGTLSNSLAFMLYFGSIVLLPQLLQEVFGYTATWAGFAAAPVGLMPLLLTPIIGKFGHKIDMRHLVTFSFIIYTVCFYWRAYTFEPGMDFAAAAWPQFVQGLAMACFFMPLTTITLSGLSPERMASASSLSNFTRILSGSIGTSITTTMWTQREALHHANFSEYINAYNPNYQQIHHQLAQLGMNDQQISAYLAKQITHQGLIISANEIFWLSAAVFLILTLLVWIAKPPFSVGNKDHGGAH
ncbi:multidrug efflux MFS transporter permease subunit EmrB [Xenorhabdus nematophila]|uniref:Multidrug transport protein (MFS family) n=1 Tax=Xenorhabdus nematophila (strain ATCC 19061 / DSM 3370 / CCUG 14189 / LMG 1036 / NCIMB 9965 / AN6) TaxID=406817 RepID=D3V9Y6_XENNA|nr:multidrug efflux MFS transporter permease subunit EmrB [Xenorhabdus nematophila]CEE94499.1 multidrug transport protein (MFS family) [Xenorhabdus nematophila str. Anatoliense]CEF31812.1 multidrug transport protein (MFS family) [Xenorhabdus nematophila str. Websteri]AYA39599.1 multidrug efflux MFS transporter subunit EmrB [Xenorhabdus nematophila]KHD29340.1 multidrug resistance protein B [Xenorhabdus nematophila]MBA0018164.1 multidrug efflux MFS transporter permease subunit EmrB [Xenorhabdus 